MPKIRTYEASVVAVLKFIKQGKLSIRDAAEILDCSPGTVQKFMKEFGIEAVSLNTVATRKEKSEANAKRNDLLTTLAKQVKYDDGDITALCAQHKIPTRTLYRWVLKV